MTEERFEYCIRQIVKGGRNGLKEIYEAYLAYIFSIVSGIVKRREDAEDVTSEFFIRIWNTAEQYRPGHGHKAYLAAIARNMSIDFLRKSGREIPADFSAEEDCREDNTDMAGREAAKAAHQSPGFEDGLVESLDLKKALDTLNDREREVVNLKIMGDLTFREIAEILKTPIGTVTWRYRVAVEKMRRLGYE